MNIYEAIGIGYAFIATIIFTAQLIYFSIKGLTHMQGLISRGQAEESLDLQQSKSIRSELAKVH